MMTQGWLQSRPTMRIPRSKMHAAHAGELAGTTCATDATYGFIFRQVLTQTSINARQITASISHRFKECGHNQHNQYDPMTADSTLPFWSFKGCNL